MPYDHSRPLHWDETYPGTPDSSAKAVQTYVSGNPPWDCREHCLALCAMKAERNEARRWAGVMYRRALKAEAHYNCDIPIANARVGRLLGILRECGRICECGEVTHPPSDLGMGFCDRCGRPIV